MQPVRSFIKKRQGASRPTYTPPALSLTNTILTPSPPVNGDNVNLSSPFVFMKVGKQTIRLPGDGTAVQLGKNKKSPVQFESNVVSRQHAEVRARNGSLEIRDTNSTNGTYVGGQMIKPGEWHQVGPDAKVVLANVEAAWSNDGLALAKQDTPPPAAPRPAPPIDPRTLQNAGAAVGGPVGAGLTLAGLKKFAGKKTLESEKTLLRSLAAAKSEMAKQGGIVELPRGVPTMVIPDIHAQRNYLTRALEHEIEGEKVFDLVKDGRMNLLCLGDGMHSEGRSKDRWQQAERDSIAGQPSRAMYQEMVESMGTMKMVMDLKSDLGDNFAYLRGNHDDINPEHGYKKYTTIGESNLVKDWVTDNYGDRLLHEWASFEESMPLVAKGSGFVASHAAPGRPLKADEITSRSERTFGVLAWTDNTHWEETQGERQVFEDNLKEVGADPGARWFVGHRKVADADYRGQFDDQLIQINPFDHDGFVVSIIGANGEHNPERDTFRV